MIYKSIPEESKELFKDRILIPIPDVAPVDSAAMIVVKEIDVPNLTAVIINGIDEGTKILLNISKSDAPKILAALIKFGSILIMP